VFRGQKCLTRGHEMSSCRGLWEHSSESTKKIVRCIIMKEAGGIVSSSAKYREVCSLGHLLVTSLGERGLGRSSVADVLCWVDTGGWVHALPGHRQDFRPTKGTARSASATDQSLNALPDTHYHTSSSVVILCAQSLVPQQLRCACFILLLLGRSSRFSWYVFSPPLAPLPTAFCSPRQPKFGQKSTACIETQFWHHRATHGSLRRGVCRRPFAGYIL
jgi:hypothetical protein